MLSAIYKGVDFNVLLSRVSVWH